jgi:hypothetical protein
VTASAFPPPPLPQHRANHQADGSSSYYLSPRTITALEDFEKQSRDPNVLYGRDVIQVPLKVEDRNEYVNLVLSHREFDMMAVHIPQYDEMQPVELLEEITKILKEEEKNRKMKQGIAAAAGADAADSVSIFQARILELEFEMKRLNTKLAAARSLQSRYGIQTVFTKGLVNRVVNTRLRMPLPMNVVSPTKTRLRE